MSLPLFDRLETPAEDPGAATARIWRVSELNRAAKTVLEQRWGDVWIEGELSDVTKAATGHIYFTLNDVDPKAQIRGVLFRSDAAKTSARFERGEVVRVRGALSIWEPRGTFQLIARAAVPAGEGDLKAAFERVRRKLEEEGLLRPERKRRLPMLPRVVGVVTSAQGAAMHDIIRVARARCPVRIVVADCRVQGAEAPASIVRALENIQRLPDLDVVIVGRGGGSAEDLSAFSDESVARAVAACRVPIVSAVGHEIDVALTDLVADVRASTPSNAAEIVVAERAVLLDVIANFERRLVRAVETQVDQQRLGLERLAKCLADPRARLGRSATGLEQLRSRLARQALGRLRMARARLHETTSALHAHDPRRDLAEKRSRWLDLSTRLRAEGHADLARRRSHFATTVARLEALSPLGVLGRGYAIALHEKTGVALVRSTDAKPGDRVTLRLHEGRLHMRVEESE